MTEAEWMACADPHPMLSHLFRPGGAAQRKGGLRKLRLFACACVRRLWKCVTAPRSRRAVETAERYADGLATRDELRAAEEAAEGVRGGLVLVGGTVRIVTGRAPHRQEVIHGVCDLEDVRVPQTAYCAALAAAAIPWVVWERKAKRKRAGEWRAQAALLREIFGSPFRPASIDPALRTPDAAAIARSAYVERAGHAGTLDPVRLAVLADALEDAGCTDAELLAHLRSPGPHVRGCWALDLILGKE